MRAMTDATWAGAPVALGIVADRAERRTALALLAREYPEFVLLGVESGSEEHSELLAHGDLQVLIVNLPLEERGGRSAAIEYVRRAKAARPDVRLLLLKRPSEERLLRESLAAGADGCCLQTISSARLALAVKALSVGAAWLDPGISEVILHGAPALPVARRNGHNGHAEKPFRLSPREHEVLTLLSEGSSNDEIAGVLQCSTATVKTHLSHIFQKLEVTDRVSAVVTALRSDLL